VGEQRAVGGGLGAGGVLPADLVGLELLELPGRLGVLVRGEERIRAVVHDVPDVLLGAEEREVFLVGARGLQVDLPVVGLLRQRLQLRGQVAGQLLQLDELLPPGGLLLERIHLHVHGGAHQELDVLLLRRHAALGGLEGVVELLGALDVQVRVGLDLHQLPQRGDGPLVLLLMK